MYKVIESFQKGKKNISQCEDGMVITSAFAAVIDGSTSKGDYDWGDKTSGQIARDVIGESLQALSPDAALDDIIIQLTEALNRRTLEVTGKEAKELPAYNRLTASIVIYSDRLKKVWQIGDCPCLTDGMLHDNSKPEEHILAAKRAKNLKTALANGWTVKELMIKDCGRESILQDLKEECLFQNKKFALLDGTPVYKEGIKTIDVSTCKELVLASDGYPFLYPTLAESEEALQQQLSEDPLCIYHFKATKGLRPGYNSFDDRTYLRLALMTD